MLSCKPLGICVRLRTFFVYTFMQHLLVSKNREKNSSYTGKGLKYCTGRPFMPGSYDAPATFRRVTKSMFRNSVNATFGVILYSILLYIIV